MVNKWEWFIKVVGVEDMSSRQVQQLECEPTGTHDMPSSLTIHVS